MADKIKELEVQDGLQDKEKKEKVTKKDSSLNEDGFKSGEPIDMNEYFAFIAKQRNK